MRMKRGMRGLLFIGCVLLCGCSTQGSIRGGGDILIFDKSLPAFEKILITQRGISAPRDKGKAIVHLHTSNEYRAVLSIDSTISQFVAITVENDRLKIETRERIAKDFMVHIYAPTFAGICIEGRGDIRIRDELLVPSFAIVITGSGRIEGFIVSQDFSLDIRGAGAVRLNGTTENAVIRIGGAGAFDGYGFRILNARIRIAGAGSVRTWVTDTLSASITGIGSIKYQGTPLVAFGRSGMGSIKRIKYDL